MNDKLLYGCYMAVGVLHYQLSIYCMACLNAAWAALDGMFTFCMDSRLSKVSMDNPLQYVLYSWITHY